MSASIDGRVITVSTELAKGLIEATFDSAAMTFNPADMLGDKDKT